MFVSKKAPNNAVMSQCLIALIIPIDQNNECTLAFWGHPSLVVCFSSECDGKTFAAAVGPILRQTTANTISQYVCLTLKSICAALLLSLGFYCMKLLFCIYLWLQSLAVEFLFTLWMGSLFMTVFLCVVNKYLYIDFSVCFDINYVWLISHVTEQADV